MCTVFLERRQSEQSRSLVQSRRKTRLNFPSIAATRGARESENEVLRRAFVELGLPLAKLEVPKELTTKQRKHLRDFLRSEDQKRNRRGFSPKIFQTEQFFIPIALRTCCTGISNTPPYVPLPRTIGEKRHSLPLGETTMPDLRRVRKASGLSQIWLP